MIDVACLQFSGHMSEAERSKIFEARDCLTKTFDSVGTEPVSTQV